MYENAKYYNDPAGNLVGISVSINGKLSFIPIDKANSDYQNIMTLVAEGKLTIAPAEAQ